MDVCAGELVERVPQNSPWVEHIAAAFERRDIGLHLAIFAEPFLSLVLCGEKTVESRFSQNRCAPFNAVDDGDIVLMKAVGGPIRGLAIVKQTWYFYLVFQPLDQIRATFGAEICAGDEFWHSRRDAAFVTLMKLAEPIEIAPLRCDKRDRRGWVALRSRQMDFEF